MRSQISQLLIHQVLFLVIWKEEAVVNIETFFVVQKLIFFWSMLLPPSLMCLHLAKVSSVCIQPLNVSVRVALWVLVRVLVKQCHPDPHVLLEQHRDSSSSPFVFYCFCLFDRSFQNLSSCLSPFVKVTLSFYFFYRLSSPTWAAPRPPPGPPLPPTQKQTSLLYQRFKGMPRPKSSTVNFYHSFYSAAF